MQFGIAVDPSADNSIVTHFEKLDSFFSNVSGAMYRFSVRPFHDCPGGDEVEITGKSKGSVLDRLKNGTTGEIPGDKVKNPPTRPISRLFGSLQHDGPAVTVEEMEQAIADGACEDAVD